MSITAKKRIIAIGASTGGIDAITTILKELPVNIPGIVIVQHIPANFSKMFAERLGNITPFTVKEAKTGDLVLPGHVLIAPGGYHMEVRKQGNNYSVVCYKGEKIKGHCPSVDVLFKSVALEAGANAIGVILTGMGSDGAEGLLEMRKSGAQTIGQDESSSVIYGMPKVAYTIGAVEKQAPLNKIPQLILSLLQD